MLTREDWAIIVRQDRDMRIIYAMVQGDKTDAAIMRSGVYDPHRVIVRPHGGWKDSDCVILRDHFHY